MPSGDLLRLELARAQFHRGGPAGEDFVYASTNPDGPTFITRDIDLHAAVTRAWPSAALGRRSSGTSSTGGRSLGVRHLSHFQLAVAGIATVAVVAVIGAILLLGPCARLALRVVPRSIDESMGQQSLPHALAQLAGPKARPVTDEPIVSAVDAVMDRLLIASPASPFRFHVTVCDSPIFNAFALPGGRIIVTTGLLGSLSSGEELAAVLAHEMNHVLARHAMQMTMRASGARFLVHALSGGHVGMGIAGSVWSAMTVMGYSRESEAEADRLAVPLLVRAGIDPHVLLSLFDKMVAEEQRFLSAMEKTGTGRLLEKMRSHPHTAERIAAVSPIIAAEPMASPEPLDIDYPAVVKAVRERDDSPRF